MNLKANSFLRKLIEKRRYEILHSKAYKTYLYLSDLYKAREQTKESSLNKLKNQYYANSGQTWIIIKYNRIASPQSIPFDIPLNSYIEESTFKLHLEVLQKRCNIISLTTLLQYLDNGEQPPLGTVIINIDNAHNSTYFNALPLLLDREIPVTFSIPTAYIGTKLLHWDNLIEITIKIIIEAELSIGEFNCLSKEENNMIATTYTEKGIPGPHTTESLITFFLSLEPNKRMHFLNHFIDVIKKNNLSLPEYTEFMDWDQILDLKKAGAHLIPKLHTGIPAAMLKINALEKEITNSLELFKDYELKEPNVLSLPFDSYNKNTLNILNRYNIKYALGSDEAPRIKEQDSKSLLLKRKVLLNNLSNQENLFLLQLFT